MKVLEYPSLSYTAISLTPSKTQNLCQQEKTPIPPPTSPPLHGGAQHLPSGDQMQTAEWECFVWAIASEQNTLRCRQLPVQSDAKAYSAKVARNKE